MDHDYIANHQVIEHYVAGRLREEESARFEEHMIECRECQEEVSMVSDLKAGLADAEAAGALKPSAERGGFLAWLKPFGIPAPAWALAGVVLAALPAWILMRSLNQENVRLVAAMAQLRRAQEERAAGAGVPILTLSLSRGAGDGNAPVPRIHLAQGQPALVLALEYIHDPAVQSYRAILEGPNKNRLAVVYPLPPTASDTIGVEFRSSLLMPGRYSVALEGVSADGREAMLGRFGFEVVP